MRKALLSLIPLVLFSVAFFLETPLLHWLELKSMDWRFARRGPTHSGGDIAVVAIDEKSLNREGRWPWDREKVAKLVRRVRSGGADWIEMDIVFAEPDPGDSALALALAERKDTVVGYFFYRTPEEKRTAEISDAQMTASFETILPTAFPELSGLKKSLLKMSGVVANTPLIARAASAQGYFNAFPDDDGVIRRFPLMVAYEDKIFPSMSLETFSHQEKGFRPVPIKSSDGSLKGVGVGRRFIPTNRKGEVLINYRGTQAFPTYSATDVLNGKAGPELSGKTVLIGATAVGIYDLRVTPLSPILPGVLVQANLLDNLYQGDPLIDTTWTKLASWGAMILLTLFLGFFLPRVGILLGLAATVSLIGAYVYLACQLFRHDILLALATPSLEAFAVFLTINIYRGLTEEQQKKMIRSAFRHYLHPDIVEELLQNPKKLALGGQRIEATLLFCDVRDFTTMSEKMDPETLLRMMNEYFDPISQEIIKAGGYIDKFIGDAVMAVFGAPKTTTDHSLQACRAALAMEQKVRELSPIFQKKFGIGEFKIGIGIHTGPVTIGNIGTSTRLNYTVMGDTVNLASRLEGVTKTLGAGIVISEKTYQKVQTALATRYLDEISVKGKEEKIRVYELVPD